MEPYNKVPITKIHFGLAATVKRSRKIPSCTLNVVTYADTVLLGSSEPVYDFR